MNYIQKYVQNLLLEANIINPEYLRRDLEYQIKTIRLLDTNRDKEIAQWLNTTLYNHILREDPNNSPNCIADWMIAKDKEMVDHAAEMFGTNTAPFKIPEWAYKKVSSTNPIHFFNGFLIDKWEKILYVIDYFRDTPDLNISRISVPEAIRQAEDWHTQFQRDEKIQEGTVKRIRSFNNGYSIVQLVDEQSYKREGALMQHCVAAYAGRTESVIYSLRDTQNEPHTTIEVDATQTPHTVVQIKGKQNAPPVQKYVPYLVEFLQNTDWHVMTSDARALGYEEIPTFKEKNITYMLPGTPKWNEVMKVFMRFREGELRRVKHDIYDVGMDSARLTNMYLTQVPAFLAGTKLSRLDLSDNKLKTLSNMPTEVNYYLNLDRNKLITLSGLPPVLQSIDISFNDSLTSFKGLEKYKQLQRVIANNINIKSLEYLPKEILYLNCSNTKITSLEGGPSAIQELSLNSNDHLRSLKGIPEFKILDDNTDSVTVLTIHYSPKITLDNILKEIPYNANIQYLDLYSTGVKRADEMKIREHLPRLRRVDITELPGWWKESRTPSFKDFLEKS